MFDLVAMIELFDKLPEESSTRDETVIKERSKLATLIHAQELKQENKANKGSVINQYMYVAH